MTVRQDKSMEWQQIRVGFSISEIQTRRLLHENQRVEFLKILGLVSPRLAA